VAQEPTLQFDGWTVNRLSGELSREGRGARLPQQPLRILVELFDHAGAVVTREQLVKALWPAGVVDFDNGLNVAVRKLRVALDDVGDTPRYIETLPRVGYRFIGKPGDAPVAPAAPAAMKKPLARIALVCSLVVLAVGLGLSAWLWSGTKQTRHVPSERAQELYLAGLQLRSRRDLDVGHLSIDKFEQALREDPNYPEAWGAYGEGISVAVIRQTMTPAEGVPKARAAAERSIALAPDLPNGHTLLGQIHMDYDKDFAAAKREFDRALQLNDQSSLTWHHMAMWHGQQGNLDAAFAAIRRARELEPTRPVFAMNFGLLLYEARRFDEAIAIEKTLLEMNPKYDQARSVLVRSLLASGDPEEALAQAQNNVGDGPNQGDLGMVYAKLGRRDDALREIALLDERARRGFAVAYEQAQIFAGLGDLDQACAALERGIVDRSLLVNWMRLEPRLDPLRGSKCYQDADRKLYGTR